MSLEWLEGLSSLLSHCLCPQHEAQHFRGESKIARVANKGEVSCGASRVKLPLCYIQLSWVAVITVMVFLLSFLCRHLALLLAGTQVLWWECNGCRERWRAVSRIPISHEGLELTSLPVGTISRWEPHANHKFFWTLTLPTFLEYMSMPYWGTNMALTCIF